MLGELKAIHADLREAIAELAVAVRNAEPDEGVVSAARLKLTKLSRRRRSLIEFTICPSFHDAPPAAAAAVADLLLEGARLTVKSSEHIGRWTMSAIRADWPGYQRASAEMRGSMLKRIEREAAVLYPLLEAKVRATSGLSSAEIIDTHRTAQKARIG